MRRGRARQILFFPGLGGTGITPWTSPLDTRRPLVPFFLPPCLPFHVRSQGGRRADLTYLTLICCGSRLLRRASGSLPEGGGGSGVFTHAGVWGPCPEGPIFLS